MIQGLAELRPRLLAIPDKMLKRILQPSLRIAANVVKDREVELVPVDTGAARDSIKVVARRGTPTRVVFNVVAGGDLSAAKQAKHGIRSPYYVVFLEFGTVKMRAQPFARPAFEQEAPVAVDMFVIAVGDRLPQVVSP